MINDSVLIRRAGIDDIHTIRALAHEIWPHAYGQLLSGEQLSYMLELIYHPAALTSQLQDQGHNFLLAALHEKPVGFAAYSRQATPGIFKLQKLYVKSAIQGRGIGKALMDAVIMAVRAEQGTTLQLNVNRQNKARYFYEKEGFSVIKEENIDIGQGFFMNDYVMEKTLAIGC